MLPRTLLLVIALYSPLLSFADEVLRLGMFAYRPKAVMAEKYDALGVYLSASLPTHRVVMAYLTQDELEKAVAEKRVDFVFTNPSDFVLLRHRHTLSGALATLQVLEQGQTTALLGGVILAPAKSDGITTLETIRGKRIAIPGKAFLGGYQTQAFELLELADIRLPDDATLIDVGSHDAVVATLLKGEADLGFVRTGILESMLKEGKLQGDEFRVINPQNHQNFPYISSTRLYPEWALSALPHVPEEVVKRVSRALLFITPDMSVAENAGFGGFTIPGDYQRMDELTRSLRLPPHEQAQFGATDIWEQYRWAILALFASGVLVLALSIRLASSKRRLEKAHNRLQNIASHVPGMVYEYLLRPNGSSCFPYASDAIQQIYELDHDLVQDDASRVFEIVHPEDIERVVDSIHTSARNLTPWRCEYRVNYCDGSTHWLEGNALPYAEVSGAIRWYGFITDVTQRKETERELESYRNHLETLVTERTVALTIAKDAAEAGNRAKTAFLANMSHELRTPMHAIMALTGIAIRKSTDPGLTDKLGKISASADRMMALLEHVLNFSKLDTDTVLLEHAPFSIEQISGQLEKLTAAKAKAKQLDLLFEITPQLVGLRLLGDQRRLQEVLLNLLHNAIRFTEAGNIVLSIRLASQTPAEVNLAFSVRDTGIGIAAEIQQRIFEHFEQGDNSMTRQYGGTGLGLAISQRLIQMMGGTIRVNSEAGAGSDFYFSIKLPVVAG